MFNELVKSSDIRESKSPDSPSFHDIKPEKGMTVQAADKFWKSVFKEEREPSEKIIGSTEARQADTRQDRGRKTDSNEVNLERIVREYVQDIKAKSEYPETISDVPFKASDLRKISPEENAKMHDEYDDKKSQLIKGWEESHGISWPRYDHDIYSEKGNLIRKAGSKYDAHHIQPLGLGGKNEVSNITPVSAEKHYDSQGIHAPGSPYDKLTKTLGGKDI